MVDTSFKLLEAAGGHDGIRLAEAENPDVIFLDLNMPDLNGYDVLRKLRTEKITKDIPVVWYTSNIPAAEKIEGFTGIIGVLSKDLSSRETSRAALTDLIAKAEIFAKK